MTDRPSPVRSSRAWRQLRRDLFERPEGNLRALDGLRALAVLLVLAFHCALFSSYATPTMEAAGTLDPLQQVLINLWSGVDVFFVLSGFLIGRILLRDLARDGRLYWPSFFLRRSFRIVPAYYLVLTAILFVVAPRAPRMYSLLWQTRDFAAIRDSAWANYLYVSNYVIAPGAPDPMSWSWSLCIEEHFYLVLPPLLWLTVRRTGAVWHGIGIAAGLLLPFFARLAAYVSDPDAPLEAVYGLSHYRFDELFVGVVVAYLHLHHSEAFSNAVRRAGLALPGLGAIAMGTTWWFGSVRAGGLFPVVVQFPLFAWGVGALIAHVIVVRGSPLARALGWRGWYPIARVSYGIYLVHVIVVFELVAGPFRPILHHAHPLPLLALFFGTTLAVSWALAAVLFTGFERPLLDVGGRLAGRMGRGGRARRGAGASADVEASTR